MEVEKREVLADYPEVLDARDIAEFLRIGYVKALHLVRFGGLDYLKIGRCYRVSRSSFKKWLEQTGKNHVC